MKGNNMNNLKDYSTSEIIKMIEEGKVTNADLTDSGICPTCFNKQNNDCLYGDNTSKILYEDEDLECYLVGNPRTNGHAIVAPKAHYKDLMECPPDLYTKVMLKAQILAITIKKVYSSESVYLVTMCDGPMNHFHVQLIPRYANELRGSKNFVKPRKEYEEDLEKRDEIRKILK